MAQDFKSAEAINAPSLLERLLPSTLIRSRVNHLRRQLDLRDRAARQQDLLQEIREHNRRLQAQSGIYSELTTSQVIIVPCLMVYGEKEVVLVLIVLGSGSGSGSGIEKV